jgi:CRP-like cAMP-binding protein
MPAQCGGRLDTRVDLIKSPHRSAVADPTYGERIEQAGQLCAFEQYAPEVVLRRRIHRWQSCFLPTQRATYVFHLHSGAVGLYRLARFAREGMVSLMMPGTIFGLNGIKNALNDTAAFEHRFDARAITTVEYCAIPGEVIVSGLRSSLEIVETVIHGLSERIYDGQILAAFAAQSDLDRRAIAVLWILSTRLGVPTDDGVLVEGFSHEDLGEMIAVTRSTVTRLLAGLERRKLLEVRRRHLFIADPARLLDALN